jgi:DNA repair protein SbcC/Rad50
VKPLKLTMQAFGPYAEVETIDFTYLGNRTMFVISGKTGSGKTTIFDAISYAIYGKASGEDRNGSDLRSQFAKDDLNTEVSLDFSIRNKVYSITRSPQQQKKKEKGEGLTQVPAKATLYVLDEKGEKTLLASKINDVDEKIKEIMLIDSNQFRQILMIPQGEFRKLLTSDSKDKEVILQRLFHTQIYKMVEEKLKTEASELKKSVEDQVQARNEAIRRIYAVTNEELKGYLEADSENDTIIMPLLQAEIAGMADLLEKISFSLKEKEQEQDLLKGKLLEAEGILRQLQTKETLTQQKADLESQTETFIEKEKQVRLAQKAAFLAVQEELCQRLKLEVDRAAASAKEIKIEIERLEALLVKHQQQLQLEMDREVQRQQMLDNINRLINMKEDVYSFAALEKEVAVVDATLRETIGKHQTSERNLLLLGERVKDLQQQKSVIEQGQLAYVENERHVEKLQAELAQFEKYDLFTSRYIKALQDLKVNTGKYENTVSRYMDAKVLVEDLEEKWMHGQASLIAARLQTGDACPVCGSEHHPAPALINDENIPNEEDLKSAKKQAAHLEKVKSEAESIYYQSQSIEKAQKNAVEEIVREIRSHRPEFSEVDLHAAKAEVTTKIESLIKTQNGLEEQILQLDRTKIELEKKESDIQNLKESIQRFAQMVTELTVQFTEKNTNLTRLMNNIPEDLRSEAAYEKTLSASKKKYEVLVKQFEEAGKQVQIVKEKLATESARLVDSEKRLLEKQDELSIERVIFKNRLSEQGFENYGVYHSSKKSEQEIREFESEIRNYREELRSITDRLQDLVKLLKDVKKPEVAEIKSELEEKAQEIEDLNQRRTDLFVKKRDNEETYLRIESLNEQMKVLEERYKLIGHLSKIAKGDNTYRITFERYVLAAFLDDILQEANIRLRKMTSGRFQMLRKTDRSKGNVQSGLELLVYDQYTSQERHVKTLSGGESFKAALSLALGLADVVQNYAGGVSLETMFIDEGFGTLDPESLEQAIEALVDIQSSGRLVGIISHVPELKERIDVRLEVSAGQTGSKTEFVFTN